MPATDTSGVKIVINVVDANSGEVISRTVKNLDLIGESGAKAGKQVADGMTTASAAITTTDAAAEKGSAAFSQRVKRMSADHADMVGKISRGQQQIQQAMSKGFTGASGFGGSSFSNGPVSDLKKFEAAGVSATGKVGSGFKEMGGHITTNLNNAQLLSGVIGARIPRAMEAAISRSEAFSEALSRISGGLLALGTGEIVFELGKETYDFYQKMIDINAEVRKYEQGAARASAQKLFAASDIETQIANLRLLNSEVGKLQQQQTKAAQGGLLGFAQGVRDSYKSQSGMLAQSDKLGAVGLIVRSGVAAYDTYEGNSNRDANLAQDLQSRDGANEKIFTDRQAAQMERLKATLSAQAQGLGQVAAAAQKEQADRLIAALTMRQTRNLDLFHQRQYDQQAGTIRSTMGQQGKSQKDIQTEIDKLGPRPQVDPNAGQQQFNDTTFAAQEAASGQRREISKKENDEIAEAQARTREAGLQGEARYRMQLASQIDAFERKVRDGEMTTTAAHKLELDARSRYDKEYAERRKTEQAETARIQQEAAGAGMSGLAKLDNARATRLAELDKQRPAFSDDATYGQRRSAIEAGSGADAQKLQSEFIDHIKQMDDARANSSMSANAHILADTRRTVDELQKAFDSLYGGLGANDPRRAQGQQALDAEKGRINTSAQNQVARNNQELANQTAKMQAEAGRGGGGNRYAEQGREIELQREQEYERTKQQIEQAQREGDLFAVQQYQQQLAAINQTARNKELDLAREQRDKLAGELKGFFSNPLDALKRQGEDVASKAAADLLMGHLPGRKGAPGNKGAGLFDGGADAIFRPFHKGSGNGAGAPGAHHDITSAIAPQQAVVNATTATINVGSASFNGAGAPSSAVRGVANGGYVSTGDGGLFNLGGAASGETGSGSGAFSSLSAGDTGSEGNSSLSALTGSSDPFSAAGTSNPFSTAMSGVQTGVNAASDLGKDLGIFGSNSSGDDSSSSPGGFGDLGKDLGIFGGNPSDPSSSADSLSSITSSDDPFKAAGSSSPFGADASGASSGMGAAGGAIGGAMGMYSAFEGKGGVMGGLKGALSGAEFGASIGGPVGAVIGAAAGAVLGFIGHGARVEAQKYWFKELMPKAQQDMLGFQSGAEPYQTAYDDFTSMQSEAKQRTQQMGPGAVDYYNDTIKPRIDSYQQQLTRQQKAGRTGLGMQAAQFHNGGILNNFGSLATSPTEGFFHGERGETVLHQQASLNYGDVAMMMNAGAPRSDIADYMGGGGAAMRPVADAPDMHFHFSTHDAKTAYEFFMANKHTVREALNGSYAENAGGSN